MGKDEEKMSESFKLLMRFVEERGEDYIARNLREYRRDAEWIAFERERLRERYPDRYIAVKNQQVIETDEDFATLLRKVEEKYGEAENITYDYISRERIKLLL